MERIFTILKSARRALVAALVLVAASTNAFASDEGYFNYYVEMSAYPSGAGLVYADVLNAGGTELVEGVDEAYVDYTTPAEKVEVKYYAAWTPQGVYGVAVPANGWIFAGFSAATEDADGNFVFNDNIVTKVNPGYLNVTSVNNFEAEDAAKTSFSIFPDTAFYALFTHVAPIVADGQDSLGTVSISKVCNEFGDNVTITATPNDAGTTTFDYWINKTTGEKITDNPLSILVQDTAYYEAHFNSSEAVYLTFPEEGGYMQYYSDDILYVPSNVDVYKWEYYAGYDSLMYDPTSQKFYQMPEVSSYSLYAHEPVILYGKGEATLYKDKYSENYLADYYLLRWSGSEGVKVDTLAVSSHYYSVDAENREFHLIASTATIEPNTVYLEMPNERYTAFGVTEAPETIYWDDPTIETGIKGVSADNAVPAAKKGIYTMGGAKVKSMNANGLYIIDGKKVINLKK